MAVLSRPLFVLAAAACCSAIKLADTQSSLQEEFRKGTVEERELRKTVTSHVVEAEQLVLNIARSLINAGEAICDPADATKAEKPDAPKAEKVTAKVEKKEDSADATKKPADAAAAAAAPVVAAPAAPAAAVEKVSTKKADTPIVEKIPTHKRMSKEEMAKKHPTKVVFPKEFDVLSKPYHSAMDNKLTQVAMMVPMLETMYEKFKGDIKNNNKLEVNSKKRLEEYTKAYNDEVELVKKGKSNYLLEEKKRAMDYFGRQRNIQKRHYRAMLKMAHSSMERLNKVKKMVEKASTTGKLDKDDLQDLQGLMPTGLMLF